MRLYVDWNRCLDLLWVFLCISSCLKLPRINSTYTPAFVLSWKFGLIFTFRGNQIGKAGFSNTLNSWLVNLAHFSNFADSMALLKKRQDGLLLVRWNTALNSNLMLLIEKRLQNETKYEYFIDSKWMVEIAYRKYRFFLLKINFIKRFHKCPNDSCLFCDGYLDNSCVDSYQILFTYTIVI